MLLWARRDGGDPFEVSKVVTQPLQPRCPSAPRCPTEVGVFQTDHPAWIDPTEPPLDACAYEFSVRGECLRRRNQLALQCALFKPNEVQLTKRLLEVP